MATALSKTVTAHGMMASPEVLIIDDDELMLEAMVRGLRDLGLRVTGCTRSIEALMKASESAPMTIVVDLKMPRVDGLDLVTALCDMKRHAVIVLSAYVDVPTTDRAMRLGAADVLQKPIGPEQLYGAVKEAAASVGLNGAADEVTFTRRERQVAALLIQGMTAKQIALHLELSPRTVEFFKASLLRKTRSPNSAALASALTRIGFV